MKKILLSLSLVAIFFGGCKKEDNDQTAATNSNATSEREVAQNGSIPSTFTQKLLIEMLSTAYCATCPDAEQKFRNFSANHPNRMYGVSIHNSDAMETSLYNSIDSCFSIPYYASGMLNRTPFGGVLVLPKGSWNANINTCLNKTATCGLKINSSIHGTTAMVDVYSAFNTSLTGDYRLTVYLFENDVTGIGPGYDQSNYYNGITNSQWFGLGDPIVGYHHDFVVRQTLTANLGNAINPLQIHSGSCIKRSFNVNISGYNGRNLYVVAFINKVTVSNMTHEVMNVQQTKLGTNKNFD